MEGSEGYGKVGSDYYYSATGNITNFEGTAFCYQDPAHKHAITHLGGTAAGNQKYWYNANGNSTRRINGSSDITMIYDEENRLTGMSGAVSAGYVYDGDPLRFAAGLCGNRVKATVGGVTTVYIGNIYEWDNGTTV